MVKYMANVLNAKVNEMVALGRDESATHCDKVLAKFHKENNIGIEFGNLDDSVQDDADDLKEILISFGKRPMNFEGLPKTLNDHLKQHAKIGEHAKHGKVIVLKSPSKFIEDWIETTTSKSQSVSMRKKGGRIAELCNESDDHRAPIRLSGYDKSMKGVMVKIPAENKPKTVDSYTSPPTERKEVTYPSFL